MKTLTKLAKPTSHPTQPCRGRTLDAAELRGVCGGADTAASVTYGPVITVKPKG